MTTSGFAPHHLYMTPALDRAMEISRSINSFGLWTMGVESPKDDDRWRLSDLSIREMLDAVDLVEQWNDRPGGNSATLVPAERLTAAVYVLLHYPLRPQDDDQDMIVGFDDARYGTTFKHALIVVRQEMSATEEDAA